jgi:NAD(P)-dependent dehydrogenase (short-subunit alcohol dehydrogenase family)
MSVLITGASGGLGTAVYKAFVDSGTHVIGAARTGSDLDVDLTSSEGAAAMIAAALQHGPLDALVHLVGAFAGGAPVAETDDKTWDTMINLNLRAAFLCIRAALKPMVAAKRGRILVIGARAALDPFPDHAAYAVSKAAVVALVRNVAAEVKDLGITANVILPSVIDTPINRQAMPTADFSKWVAPESIARLLVWLASDGASDVSGAVIPIYGKS